MMQIWRCVDGLDMNVRCYLHLHLHQTGRDNECEDGDLLQH
jgi:hypothetical protein